MIEVPITPLDPYQGLNFETDEHTFHFNFQWLDEIEHWVMDTEALTSDFTVLGKLVVPGTNLWAPYAKRFGYLFVLGNERIPISFESLGTSHILYWIGQSEIDEL